MPNRLAAKLAPDDLKRCTRCNHYKAASEFPVTKGGCGRASVCKPCKARMGQEWRAAKAGHITPADIARFWSRIKKGVPGPLETDCWIWQGAPRNADGYGQYHWAGSNTSPHLIALSLVGRVATEDAPIADHICRVRMCCNPDHLRFVTHRENSVENNDSPFAINARKQECAKCGTPYSNTSNLAIKRCISPSGTRLLSRVCLTCWPREWRFAVEKRDPPSGMRARKPWVGPQSWENS